ncbi:MAG: hypothetical protein D6805_07945 [Planctomycetota bacterium]|nr:MAG: hypothetical protein D6805_07945 [Planctomycetota bacterium]
MPVRSTKRKKLAYFEKNRPALEKGGEKVGREGRSLGGVMSSPSYHVKIQSFCGEIPLIFEKKRPLHFFVS